MVGENQADEQTFDHDRIVAALRRALASRDQELSSRASELDSAIEQITQLQAELSILEGASGMASTQHEADLLDFHHRLESTRTELVNTINEKAEKIDALESSVLDLRTSREEVMLEGEIRADELKAQLATAVDQCEVLKASHTVELDGLRNDIKEAKLSLEQLGDVQRRLEKVDQEHQSALRSLDEQKKIALVHEEEIAKYRTLAEVSTTELEKLRSEASLRRNLEGDQAKLEAMLVAEREGRKMAEKDNLALVQQLGELRELKASRQEWEAEKRQLLDELEITKTTAASHHTRIAEMTISLEESTLKRETAEKTADQHHQELTATKQALREHSSEVYRLQMDLSTKTAESSNMINSLESQIMAEKARCQMLQDSKAAVDAAFEEQSTRLGAMSKDLDEFRSAVSASSSSTTKQAALIASLEEQVRIESGARKTSDEVRIALDKEVIDLKAAVEGHETEVVRLCAESEAARRKMDQIKTDLDEERKSHKATEAKLGVAETAALDRQIRINNLDSELQAANVKLKEQERHLVDLSTQLDQANRDRSRAEEALHSTASGHSSLTATLRSEVDGHKSDLRAKEEALASMAIVVEESKSTKARLESDLRDKEKALASMAIVVEESKLTRTQLESEITALRAERAQIESTLSEDYKELQVTLDASALELSDAKVGLAAAELARTDLQAQYDSLSKVSAAQLQDTTNQVLLLERRIEEMVLHLAGLEKQLSSSEAGRLDAEKRLGDLMAGGSAKETALKEVQEHVNVLQRRYDEQGALLSTTKADLDTRIAALATLENNSKSTLDENQKLSTKVDTLVEEMNHQRVVLKDTQAQLDKARSDLVSANTASKKLSEDLASARADAAIRQRHTSTPTGSHTGTVVLDNLRLQALKSASTGENVMQDKLRTKESGEIKRLEKVIEAQKEVIDDQREKIKFWARVRL
jgi:centromeric protein E